VKRTGRNEPTGVAIHICMEISQGNSMYSYLYLKLAKTSSFSFNLSCFFLLQNQRTGEWHKSCGGGGWGTSGRRR
jgi:hypothetical protein